MGMTMDSSNGQQQTPQQTEIEVELEEIVTVPTFSTHIEDPRPGIRVLVFTTPRGKQFRFPYSDQAAAVVGRKLSTPRIEI
jgi:hypothetical protein